MGEAGRARWKTRSTSMKRGWMTSWRISSKNGWVERWRILSLLPLKKLSMQATSFPSPRRCSQRWLPRKPAPPVTRILLIPHSLLPVGHEQEALPLEGGLLGLDDLLDTRGGQAEG